MSVKSLITSGIVNFEKGNSMLAGYSFQDFHHLESIILGGAAASVTFTNLLQYSGEFRHLQLRIVGRTTRAADFNGAKIRFNGSANTDYSYHDLTGNGSSVASFGDATSTYFYIPIVSYTSANAPANSFGATITDILDAFSTTKNKTMRTLLGRATGHVGLGSAAWYDTAAISSMVIEPDITSNWVAGSRFSLYGVK